jgi:hypothetical protein
MLVGIIAVMGIGLYLISKTGGENLNLSEEARIEKIWDESELEDSSGSNVFVPSPPPMDKKRSSDSGEEKAQDHNTTRSNRHTKHDGGDTDSSEEGDEKAQDHNTTRSNRHTKNDGGESGDGDEAGDGKKTAQDHNTTRSNRS